MALALRSRLVRAAKAFGSIESAPQAMRDAAENVSQMGPQHPFSPGEPVGPYDGYSRTPRQFDYQTSYNVATRPRTHEMVSFDTLKGLVGAYDVAQIVIWHRIDSLRSLDWKLIAADHYNGDVTDAIPLGMAALAKPDRVNSFGTWFAKWMFDVLAYDAGCLYRMRNRAGHVVGLKVPDGTTIAPLLDYWGDPPAEPAEAYVQYVNGLPWNWLTRGDLIYEPFRPHNDSPYGRAPIESIILNANTDIRFQLYFLQRFTEGNIPAAFANAPETWNPDQIESFQEYWDSFMYGDQSRKSQVRWIPGGSTLAWSNEKDFTDAFSLFLMRKTCSAFHVVPTDIGFTETANYATGESQADVGHRVGDLPLGRYAERLISNFLQDDLKLPLKFAFDWGEEQDDRVAQAQADQIYIQNAVIGASEIREMRFGLPEAAGQTVPRVFFTTRAGPVPLSSLYAVAGPVDSETSAPAPGAVLPQTAFEEVAGVIPNPPLVTAPLAEQEFGPSAVPLAPPPQAQALPLAKEAAPAAGITSGTGVYGDPLLRDGEDDDGPEELAAVAKGELAAFRRFERARVRKGEWRDFTFEAVDAGTARRLNAKGRAAVAKAGGADPKPPAANGGTQQQPVQQAWPGWNEDLETVAYWVPILVAALLGALSAGALAAAWAALGATSDASTKPERIAELTAEAEKFLRSRGSSLETAIADTVNGVRTDGYAIGAESARAAVEAGSHLGSVAADMGDWTPGASSVARELVGSLGGTDGLSDLLRQSGVTIKSIAANRLADLAKVLADGAERGDSADAMAQAVTGLLSDPSRAQMIVATELARAVNSAAQWQYTFHGIRRVRWVGVDDDRECSDCLGNEAAGPRDMGEPFPSGDTSAPAHPLCRCVTVPA